MQLPYTYKPTDPLSASLSDTCVVIRGLYVPSGLDPGSTPKTGARLGGSAHMKLQYVLRVHTGIDED